MTDRVKRAREAAPGEPSVADRQLSEVIAAEEDLEAHARRVPGGHTRKWIGDVVTQTRTAGVLSASPGHAHATPLVYSSALASWLPPDHRRTSGRPPAPQRSFAEGFLSYSAGQLRETAGPGNATGFVYHKAMARHRPENPLEPERPQRVEATIEHLTRVGITDACHVIPCREATDEQLLAVHDQAHVDRVDSTEFYAGANIPVALGGDLYISRGTARAARLAAGGVAEAALRVARGEVSNAFALVRPPGHHCSATLPSGFCFYNNVAVAVEAARRSAEGVRKVMVLDWDVHHGNGTESVFYDDPDVLFVSIHQHYMGRGHVMHRPPPPQEATKEEGDGSGGGLKHEEAAGPAVTEDTLMALLSSSDDDEAEEGEEDQTRSSSAPGAVESVPPAQASAAVQQPAIDEQPTMPSVTAAAEAANDNGRPKRVRRPVNVNALDAADDGAALDFFASLGANVEGKCGVAGRAGSDSSRGTSSDEDDANSDSSQALSWMAGNDARSGTSGRRSKSARGESGASDAHGGSDGSDSEDGSSTPFYPGTGVETRTGEGGGAGRNVNIPWPCTGFGDAEYLAVLDALVLPIAKEFAPDMVIISSGFDCIAGDVLGSMQVSPTGIFLMTRAMLRDVTPRVVVALEGGYTLRNVALCSEAAIRALLESSRGPAVAAEGSTMLYHQMERTIAAVRREQAPHWECMRETAEVSR